MNGQNKGLYPIVLEDTTLLDIHCLVDYVSKKCGTACAEAISELLGELVELKDQIKTLQRDFDALLCGAEEDDE